MDTILTSGIDRDVLDATGFASVGEIVAASIAFHRRLAGLRQADVAERVGVSRSAIGSWESARRPVTMVNIVRIASASGVSVGRLLSPLTALTAAYQPRARASDDGAGARS